MYYIRAHTKIPRSSDIFRTVNLHLADKSTSAFSELKIRNIEDSHWLRTFFILLIFETSAHFCKKDIKNIGWNLRPQCPFLNEIWSQEVLLFSILTLRYVIFFGIYWYLHTLYEILIQINFNILYTSYSTSIYPVKMVYGWISSILA